MVRSNTIEHFEPTCIFVDGDQPMKGIDNMFPGYRIAFDNFTKSKDFALDVTNRVLSVIQKYKDVSDVLFCFVIGNWNPRLQPILRHIREHKGRSFLIVHENNMSKTIIANKTAGKFGATWIWPFPTDDINQPYVEEMDPLEEAAAKALCHPDVILNLLNSIADISTTQKVLCAKVGLKFVRKSPCQKGRLGILRDACSDVGLITQGGSEGIEWMQLTELGCEFTTQLTIDPQRAVGPRYLIAVISSNCSYGEIKKLIRALPCSKVEGVTIRTRSDDTDNYFIGIGPFETEEQASCERAMMFQQSCFPKEGSLINITRNPELYGLTW